jgi:hypothetical protein
VRETDPDAEIIEREKGFEPSTSTLARGRPDPESAESSDFVEGDAGPEEPPEATARPSGGVTGGENASEAAIMRPFHLSPGGGSEEGPGQEAAIVPAALPLSRGEGSTKPRAYFFLLSLRQNGHTVRETAHALGMSHANVMVVERRALAKLAVGLSLDEDEVVDTVRRYMGGERRRLRKERGA